MTATAPVHIDLQGVTQSDSVGIALLIAWTYMARKQKKDIYFLHISEQMHRIMRVSDIEKLLFKEVSHNG